MQGKQSSHELNAFTHHRSLQEMSSSVPQNERIIFDSRILPHFLPYVVVSVAIPLLAYLLPFGAVFVRLCGGNERAAFMIGTFVVHEFLWCLNALFVVFDHWHLLRRFKIARSKAAGEMPSNELLRRSIRQQLLSHLVIQIAALYFLYDMFVKNGSTWLPLRDSIDVSSLATLSMHVFVATFVNDALFYGFHVLMHAVPLLYQRIHSVHHEFIATTGFAAEYAHPVEALIGNQLPALLVPVWLGFQFDLFLSFLALRLIRTYVTHCGYRIPWLIPGNVIHHDIHHTVNVGNYGGTPFFDLLFGTYNSKWFQRHVCDKLVDE